MQPIQLFLLFVGIAVSDNTIQMSAVSLGAGHCFLFLCRLIGVVIERSRSGVEKT